MKRIIKNNSILKIVNNYVYDSLLPINLNYWYNYGSILGIILIIQIVTGVMLAMNYIPNINLAFDSIEYIMREVNYGWLIRYMHSNGASMFFIIVYLHICRGLIYGSYLKRMTWIIGIVIFFIMMGTAFIGYSLVYGQMSYWGVTVITNLITVIPYIGSEILSYIWGGWSISNATLNRFYAIHYLLPFVIVGLTMGHLIALHDNGASNPLGISSNKKIINFHPYYTYKDIIGFIGIIIIIMILIIYGPNKLSHTDNYIPANPLVTPIHITPEFYFLPYYAILRSIPNKTIGVIGMVASILMLGTLTITHNSIISSSKFRWIYKYSLYLFILSFILLLWIGSLPVEEPYIMIGQILTGYYFIFFIITPIISFMEYYLYHHLR